MCISLVSKKLLCSKFSFDSTDLASKAGYFFKIELFDSRFTELCVVGFPTSIENLGSVDGRYSILFASLGRVYLNDTPPGAEIVLSV